MFERKLLLVGCTDVETVEQLIDQAMILLIQFVFLLERNMTDGIPLLHQFAYQSAGFVSIHVFID